MNFADAQKKSKTLEVVVLSFFISNGLFALSRKIFEHFSNIIKMVAEWFDWFEHKTFSNQQVKMNISERGYSQVSLHYIFQSKS